MAFVHSFIRLHIKARFTVTSIFIYFRIPLVWEPISLGEKCPISIKARKFIRGEDWNEEPSMYDGCVDVGVGKEPKRLTGV